MPTATAQVAALLERIARDSMKQFQDISPEDFNRQLTLPESNSLFVLATHLVGAGEFWSLVMTGQRAIPRHRPDEFVSTGSAEDLLPRYERWIQALHEALDTFPDERLHERAAPPANYASHSIPEYPLSIIEVLLHAVEHSALHLGHLQLTRQMLGYAPPPKED